MLTFTSPATKIYQTFLWAKNAHQRWTKIASLYTKRCQSWAT